MSLREQRFTGDFCTDIAPLPRGECQEELPQPDATGHLPPCSDKLLACLKRGIADGLCDVIGNAEFLDDIGRKERLKNWAAAQLDRFIQIHWNDITEWCQGKQRTGMFSRWGTINSQAAPEAIQTLGLDEKFADHLASAWEQVRGDKIGLLNRALQHFDQEVEKLKGKVSEYSGKEVAQIREEAITNCCAKTGTNQEGVSDEERAELGDRADVYQAIDDIADDIKKEMNIIFEKMVDLNFSNKKIKRKLALITTTFVGKVEMRLFGQQIRIEASGSSEKPKEKLETFIRARDNLCGWLQGELHPDKDCEDMQNFSHIIARDMNSPWVTNEHVPAAVRCMEASVEKCGKAMKRDPEEQPIERTEEEKQEFAQPFIDYVFGETEEGEEAPIMLMEQRLREQALDAATPHLRPDPPEDTSDNLKSWIEKNVPVLAQPKIDGFRAIVAVKEGTPKLWIGKEGVRLASLDDHLTELAEIGEDFVIDGELTMAEFTEDMDRPRILPRGSVARILRIDRDRVTEAIRPAGDSDGGIQIADPRRLDPDEGVGPFPVFPVIYVFDILRRDGEDLTGETLADRMDHLDLFEQAWPDDSPLMRLPERRIESEGKELDEAIREFARVPGSEGVMLKRLDVPYQKGRSQNWAKFRGSMLIEARVLEVLPVLNKPNSQTYRIELIDVPEAPLLNDTTLISKKKAEVGDKIVIEVDEIEPTASGLRLETPRVRDVKSSA